MLLSVNAIPSRKVAIVGAGAVGSETAYAFAQSGAAEEIVLSDLNAAVTNDLVPSFFIGLQALLEPPSDDSSD